MIEFTDIQIFVMVFLSVCGGIVLIGNAIKTLIPLFTPYKKLEKEQGEQNKRLDKHDQFFANDQAAIAELQKANTELKQVIRDNSRVNLAILNHFIDGNGKEEMKALREDVQNRLLGE